MDYQTEINWLLKEKYGGIGGGVEANRDVERIKRGEPVSYVIGFIDFLNCKIDLSQRPLIPRPETEFWVEKAIADIQRSALNKESIKCLDMFAGSGCIGVAVLKNVPAATVDFIDSEGEALKQIQINCELNNIDTNRGHIIKSDMFGASTGGLGTYDHIFANPPYIGENKKDEVQESVLKYEPRGALFAGEDGLKYIRSFLREAKKYLNKSGKIYMEFGINQKESIEQILQDLDYKKINFFQDQFQMWRYLVLAL